MKKRTPRPCAGAASIIIGTDIYRAGRDGIAGTNFSVVDYYKNFSSTLGLPVPIPNSQNPHNIFFYFYRLPTSTEIFTNYLKKKNLSAHNFIKLIARLSNILYFRQLVVFCVMELSHLEKDVSNLVILS